MRRSFLVVIFHGCDPLRSAQLPFVIEKGHLGAGPVDGARIHAVDLQAWKVPLAERLGEVWASVGEDELCFRFFTLINCLQAH